MAGAGVGAGAEAEIIEKGGAGAENKKKFSSATLSHRCFSP